MNRRSSLFVNAVCLTGCVLLTSVVPAGDLERLRYHTERKSRADKPTFYISLECVWWNAVESSGA